MTTYAQNAVKELTRGLDLSKQANRTSVMQVAADAGLNEELVKQTVLAQTAKQQQARKHKLQMDYQKGVIKNRKELEAAVKGAGIIDQKGTVNQLDAKHRAGIENIGGKDFKVVEGGKQAAAMAGRYGQKVATPGGAEIISPEEAAQKRTNVKNFGSLGGADASKAIKDNIGMLQSQLDAANKAYAEHAQQWRDAGAELNDKFASGVASTVGKGTKAVTTASTKLGKSIDTEGGKINLKLSTWKTTFEQQLSGIAGSNTSTPGSNGLLPVPPGGMKATGPDSMAGGGVVGGNTRRPDSVHALLKPGEVVLNEGQQRKLGMATVKKSLHGPGTAANGAFGFGNMTGAPSSSLNYASGGVVPALKPYMDAAVKLGATITSTTGGGHAANSQHYSGHAFDSDGGPAVNMKTFRAFEGDAQAGKVTELFFDPAGGYSGGRNIGAIGGHGDHAHTGIRGGAGGAANIGGMTPPPTVRAPDFGSSRMGQSVAARAAGMVPGMQARMNAAYGGTGSFMEDGASMPGSPKAIGQQMAASMYGWGGNEWSSLSELWRRESQWNPTAENKSSGAYGIPQALPASKMPPAAQKAGGSNPAAQIGWGLNYIKERYGAPSKAVAFHDRMNWYGRGGEGMATSPTTIGVGDKREHVQITPSRTEANPGGAINSVASQGPARANVTNNFYIGVLTGDEKTMRQLADMVGNTIADQIEQAASGSVADSVDVMTGNG